MNRYEALRTENGFSISDYEAKVVSTINEHVGSAHVILALSGGVDSAVCAALLAKAVPGRLHCIFVDHGLMRKNESSEVAAAFENHDLDLIQIEASGRFLEKLAGVTDPEVKRKTVGEEFIRVFEEEAEKLSKVEFLAQGTIYSDVVESGTDGTGVIKSHHNVGGLPDMLTFKGIVEPLRCLYKGEVRELGRRLGLPASLTERQPFPGPGLSVRCIGEVTREKLDVLREADAIFREEIDSFGITADQYFAVLTGVQSVGVSGNARLYGHTIALRAISTADFMTCKTVPLPYDLLERVVDRIVSGIPAVNRVVYDITNKPPATIEWE